MLVQVFANWTYYYSVTVGEKWQPFSTTIKICGYFSCSLYILHHRSFLKSFLFQVPPFIFSFWEKASLFSAVRPSHNIPVSIIAATEQLPCERFPVMCLVQANKQRKKESKVHMTFLLSILHKYLQAKRINWKFDHRVLRCQLNINIIKLQIEKK